MTDPTIHKGLAGVVVDTTAISKVVPETNSLTYRGYAVQDLAAHASFEEVAYLLWNGALPTRAQLDAFVAKERSHRALPDVVLEVVRTFPKNAHPMDTLRTVVSHLGLHDPQVDDASPEAVQDKAVRLLAAIPTAIAAAHRHARGQDFVAPRDDLRFAENVFWMTFGEVPPEATVRAFEISMVLYAEHSFNASTFTARVVTSTLSDLYSAVTAAIGALKGHLHGGANEAVMHMLQEIGEPDKARDWMLDALANKKKIMGFGHRVYRSGDSRVPTMHAAMLEMAKVTEGSQRWVEISRILQQTMLEQKGIHPNLDFPAGPAYFMMGFDIPLFTPLFVASRITGWSAHILEQAADNRLIRPLSAYSGVPQRDWVPLDERG